MSIGSAGIVVTQLEIMKQVTSDFIWPLLSYPVAKIFSNVVLAPNDPDEALGLTAFMSCSWAAASFHPGVANTHRIAMVTHCGHALNNLSPETHERFSSFFRSAINMIQSPFAPAPTLDVDFNCNQCGLFSMLTYVLGAAKQIESGTYSGISLNLAKHGLYHDPAKEGHWWNYFFLPLPKVEEARQIYADPNDYAQTVYSAEGKLSRHEAHRLIEKYIHLRPEVQQEADAFVQQNFAGQGHIIGLHYRGTDKDSEAARLSYEEVFKRIEHYVDGTHKIKDFKIFVASDEAKFIEKIKERFPGRIITSDAVRSQNGQALHFDQSMDKYQMGKSALMDALLLSRAHVLFRTSSNLSLWSTYFNPNMNVFSLSERNKNSKSEFNSAISQNFLLAKAPDFPANGGRCTHGMFATIQCMLGMLHEYDGKNYGGMQIDFADAGCYYTEDKGANWWEYYFEPVKEGSAAGRQIRTFQEMEYANPCWVGENILFRSEANQLIQKHMKIRPEIQQEVDAFAEKHFQDARVISVHYRGTDKISEAPRVEYKKAIDAVRTYIQEKKLEKFKIFVASDELAFIDEISAAFPDSVVTTNAKRSTNNQPLHLRQGDQTQAYERGKEALVDAALLAKGEAIVRTNSNLSLFSTYLNPTMHEILLNKRH